MTMSTSAKITSTITQYPYNCVCLIEDTIPGVGNFRASGVIIGPHTILTASHVLWDADHNAGASSVNIYPGYNSSDTNEPTGGQLGGKETWHYLQVQDNGGKLSKQQSQYDYAIIDTSANLSSYGSYGVSLNYAGGAATLTGYPSAHQHIQYQVSGTVSADSQYSVLNYKNFQSTPGYSGGPIWINKGTASHPLPYVVGIASTTNYASKITTAAWNTIKSWQAADASLWSGTPHASNLTSQSLDAAFNSDAGDSHGAGHGGGTTFVFTSGHETITAFKVAGADHDMISLPESDATRLGSILAHATQGADGTELHLGHNQSITILGVNVAELNKHRSDFTFHA